MTERFNVDVGGWDPRDMDPRNPDPRDEWPARADLEDDHPGTFQCPHGLWGFCVRCDT